MVSSCRVLHVITDLDRGGTEGFLGRLAPALAARGLVQEVASLTSGGVHAAGLRAEGVPVHELGMPRGVPDPRGPLRLARLIRRFRPDVVQGWLYHANLTASVALRLSGRRRTTRLLWGIRSAAMDESLYGLGLRFAVRASARLSPGTDGIVANSEVGQRDHIRLGFAAERFLVIPNGVPLERFRPDPAARAAVRAELGFSDDALVAGVFARNDPTKDLPTVMAALTAAPEIHAVFAGLGTETLSGPGRWRFLGPRDDVPRLMAACDLLLLGSRAEGFPNVVVEGMACGLPVVSTDAGDTRAIVGACGLIVPPQDPAALGAALRRMAALPADERQALSAAARRRAADRFAFTTATDRFFALYASSGAHR